MRINHNAAAVNTYSKLSSAQGAQAKSLEKLSSGLRINRAGDDAAGLAISEKMRGQISGLNQASRNAQDGISLIQTAEGGLNETHSILQRMRELAVQSANDTNTDDDRVEIQKEMNQLSQEVSRISSDTQFNGKELLDGEFSGTFHIGANKGQNMELEVKDMSAAGLGVEGVAFETIELTAELSGISITSKDGESVTLAFEALTETAADTASDATVASVSSYVKESGVLTLKLGQAALSTTDTSGAPATGATVTTKQQLVDLINSQEGLNFTAEFTGTDAALNDALGGTDTSTALNTWVPDEVASEKLGINVSSQDAANNAIETIDKAITSVSAERSKLGAVQNRLDHTINNLTATSENISAAESRIRDVDMAKEMMEFTKNNILNQASTAMLAQANQMPQGVLQLLG